MLRIRVASLRSYAGQGFQREEGRKYAVFSIRLAAVGRANAGGKMVTMLIFVSNECDAE